MRHAWLKTLTDSPAIDGLIAALAPAIRVVAEGSWGSSAALTAGSIATRTNRPVLLVVAHLDDADESQEDLRLFEGLSVSALPALEVMPGESNISLELLADRLGLAAQLMRGDQPNVVIAPVQALMQSVPTDEALGAMTLDIQVGQSLAQSHLTHWLQDAGYNRADAIDEPGDFAVRGGIIDVFSPGGQPPIRIDFFGDDVDSLAEIDLDSMGSNRKLRSARLIGTSVEKIQSNEQMTHLMTLLDESTIVVVHEMLEVAEQSRGYYERLTDPRGIYAPHTVTQHLMKFAYLEVNQYTGPDVGDQRVTLPVLNLINFSDTAVDAVKELGELTHADDRGRKPKVIALCDREAERDRLLELILEHAPDSVDDIELQVGHLHRGFGWGTLEASTDRPVYFVPHHEVFHRYQTRRRVRRVTTGRTIDTFIDVEVGDFVVHRHHGIARFKGLRVMKREDGQPGEEYLTLEFAAKALLHVPASQIELVQKYIGGFSGRPPLSKLGGTRWKKTTEQTKEAVRDLAAELLRVQAARSALPGIRYPEDTMWVKQFEAEFPYVETDDQTAAMIEIKRDMTHTQPMDRLICGDVGYGKTELAIRAAFKAVEAGKQVAVLCPTTLLCEQHERTFRQRMADYPVRVESLSRFKTGKQARQIIEQLRTGAVDVVIGTHRVLSDDVQFADIGLIIIDEEQRFGVEHKSKLMRFRVTVEVITMSATPIPRTLHMALLGLRDISSLTTPPADRRAIVTEVLPFERDRVRQAIVRELNRDGQLYFVHNR
ncbi:MAG: transcription-repair coupling factor, partial [Planctomycetaceae bacterium]|nr:transcription-repair coupling factor [Planctomycetaceae bacterium]